MEFYRFVQYEQKRREKQNTSKLFFFFLQPPVCLLNFQLCAEIFIKHHRLPEPQEDHHSLCTVSLSTPHLRCKIEINCYSICQELLCNLPAALHYTGSLSEGSNSHRLTSYRCARSMQAAIKLTSKTVLQSSGVCIKNVSKSHRRLTQIAFSAASITFCKICFHLHSAFSN